MLLNRTSALFLRPHSRWSLLSSQQCFYSKKSKHHKINISEPQAVPATNTIDPELLESQLPTHAELQREKRETEKLQKIVENIGKLEKRAISTNIDDYLIEEEDQEEIANEDGEQAELSNNEGNEHNTDGSQVESAPAAPRRKFSVDKLLKNKKDQETKKEIRKKKLFDTAQQMLSEQKLEDDQNRIPTEEELRADIAKYQEKLEKLISWKEEMQKNTLDPKAFISDSLKGKIIPKEPFKILTRRTENFVIERIEEFEEVKDDEDDIYQFMNDELFLKPPKAFGAVNLLGYPEWYHIDKISDYRKHVAGAPKLKKMRAGRKGNKKINPYYLPRVGDKNYYLVELSRLWAEVDARTQMKDQEKHLMDLIESKKKRLQELYGPE